MTENQPKPSKVAILGGGMGALATAFELSRQPRWRERFDITVYQMGHRLGGKCASSRGPSDRIEEHGIHGFLGSYYNTLPMMADVYAELGRAPGAPLATFDEAFIGSNFSMLWEWHGTRLAAWPWRLAPNTLSASDATFYKGLATSAAALINGLKLYLVITPEIPGALHDKLTSILTQADSMLGVPMTDSPAHPLVALLLYMRRLLPADLDYLGVTDGLRRAFIVFNYFSTLLLGALMDNVEAEGYDRLDGENWTDWLRRHGVGDLALSSPLAVAPVNICYQSPNGDTTRTPAMAAGAYVNWTLKSFAYLGNFLWSFGAGTGETVIAPLYTVLKARGVKFEFFQKVESLRRSEVDPDLIGSVHITVQATLKDEEAGYRPLVDVPCSDGSGTLPSWPKWPDYDQLVEGEALREAGVDLESWWNGWPREPGERRILRRGSEFDEIVYAIGPEAARHLCEDLIRSRPAWRAMVDNLPTVQTQAMQIWLKNDYRQMGWTEPMNTAAHETPCSATFIGPQNGNEEFSNLLRWENWGDGAAPKSIWYFCGLMPSYEEAPPFTDTDYPRRQYDRVKAQSIQYLQAATVWMLPAATSGARQGCGDPVCLDFGLLVDSTDDGTADKAGVQRFDSQYWRANIDPSELYVTSPPGSTAFRMEAWGSGFGNLTLAGDWIYTGLNVGSVEGAVISGKLASHALSGGPALADIVGYPTIPRPPHPTGR